MNAPLRTLAMSANIANSVNAEVGHLIRVPSDGSQVAREQPPDLRLGDGVEVLAELPPNSPFLFLVLARWDDVVGPQALFVWLPKLRGAAPHASLSRRVIYVTGHAVTCMSDTFEVGASSLSAVPDLGIAFVARQFRDDAGEAYAIAAAADHAKLDFLHSRFALVQDWLQRLADKMGPQIHQFEDDVVLGSDVTPYVLDFSYAVSTMREDSIEFSPHQEDWYGKDLFKYPAIAQALTSHLQTFGQSVVIGDNRALVNSLISFLSLFLDDEQRKRSRYVPSHGYTCFHMGLCLQGLLISGYGYRPISSDELNANPLPVTTIDFTRSIENGAVRQTEPLHKRMLGKSANFEPRSMLNPVRESVRMVTNLIEELQLLPCSQWRGHIAIFNKRLDKLAESAVCHVRRSTGTNVKEELRKMLCVDERELTIVAARAERMRPGVFVHIFGAKLNANN
ncbi:uncharacterized protein LOC135936531 [Cloeon dipterum]|uniref:uncharacterized protein LOC135936531 n=1 Tax=Cloeon dipterum TaxID=197152 RepID=UPI00322015BF